LPELWAQIPRWKPPNAAYAEQCKVKLRRFTEFAKMKQRDLEDLVEVKPETAKAFMEAEEARGISVVDQSVKDGVGDRGVADEFVPLADGKLAGDEGGAMAGAVIEDLEQVSVLFGGGRSDAQIIDDE